MFYMMRGGGSILTLTWYCWGGLGGGGVGGGASEAKFGQC